MKPRREKPFDDPRRSHVRYSLHEMPVGLMRACLAIAVLLAAAPPLHAEHARINLRVRSQNGEVAARVDEDPPAGGSIEPPVLKVKVNEPLVLQFIFTNTYPHRVVENVTVRYYVVRAAKRGRKPAPSFPEQAPGEDPLPLVEEGVVTKGQMKMDFKPECNVGARLKFRISEPGIYSVRVESVNTQSDHEHFSAIDLVAE